ncbi:MAG: DegT/DnrJ/EryC1/StrS family aminotransferase [Methylocystaceae bacterium]|nr:DegT/DnrJ/EryC1/StrS family aminotransferase [Methylocystaceae bacterium]
MINNNETKLAILGGSPTRSTPFIVEPMIDHNEEKLVLEALKQRNFSRYIGVGVDDEVLKMPSAEAAQITDYWHFLGGENVRQFSASFAVKMGTPFAIPVSSATAGLSIALAAAGIGPYDEVILPGISFSATGNAPLMIGAIPVFVDVNPETFCIDPNEIIKAISPRTKAILPVHLCGNMADMDAIMDIANQYKLKVIEDACQAIGGSWNNKKSGTIGDAGVFSFQQSKNIMTGEGGMIITSDPEIAKRCRMILNHGELCFDDTATTEELAGIIGLNFRMPELSAALGRAQLEKLDTVNNWRIKNADFLQKELNNIPGLKIPINQSTSNSPAENIPHFFTLLFDENAMGMPRSLFVSALRDEGIPVGTGYSRPMYANPTFLKRTAFNKNGFPWVDGSGVKSEITYEHGQCPVCENLLYKEFLWFYHIAYSSTIDDMTDIVNAIKKVINNKDELIAAEHLLEDRSKEYSAGRIGVAPKMLKGK